MASKPVPDQSSGIRVVYVTDGRGICAVCGNGLWPSQPPCEHKRVAMRQAQDEIDARNLEWLRQHHPSDPRVRAASDERLVSPEEER